MEEVEHEKVVKSDPNFSVVKNYPNSSVVKNYPNSSAENLIDFNTDVKELQSEPLHCNQAIIDDDDHNIYPDLIDFFWT